MGLDHLAVRDAGGLGEEPFVETERRLLVAHQPVALRDVVQEARVALGDVSLLVLAQRFLVFLQLEEGLAAAEVLARFLRGGLVAGRSLGGGFLGSGGAPQGGDACQTGQDGAHDDGRDGELDGDRARAASTHGRRS